MSAVDLLHRRDLTTPAWHYIQRVDRPKLEQVMLDLEKVYDEYKRTKTDKAGYVMVATRGGLLSQETEYEGEKFFGIVERELATGVDAWRCAGPYVSDELGLVMKLWLEFPAIQATIERHGLELVLSLVLALNHESADMGALFRANSILVGFVVAAADTWESLAHDAAREIDGTKKQREEKWKQTQMKGVEQKKKNKESGQCRQLAAYYKRDHRFAKKPEIVKYVLGRIREPDYRLDLSASYVARVIAGYEKDAELMITRQTGK